MNRRSFLAHGGVALAGGAILAFVVPDMDARATAAREAKKLSKEKMRSMAEAFDRLPLECQRRVLAACMILHDQEQEAIELDYLGPEVVALAKLDLARTAR